MISATRSLKQVKGLGACSSRLITGEGSSPILALPSGRYPRAERALNLTISARRGLSELLTMKKGDDRNKIKPGKVTPMLPIPPGVPQPSWADSGVMPEWSTKPEIHDAAGIARMRAAGQLAARVLEAAGGMVGAGVRTDEIDQLVHRLVTEAGAYPSPRNYGRFPKSVCTSVNEVICHGIPDDRPLQEGDIINIDVTVWLDGYHGDTSRTFLVGNVSEAAKKLVDTTKASLDAAIAICGPGVAFSKIGTVIQEIADKNKYGVVKQFVGHGVGKVFHAAPYVLHYRNNENNGVMKVGQTFTIEPMLTAGGTRSKMWADGWTAVTADASLTAQFEHTLLITEGGVEVLTKYE